MRILAGRLVAPPWWTNAPESLPNVLEPFVNKRPLQLAVPPVVGDATKNERALRTFLDLPVHVDANCSEALMFLDAYDANQENGAFDYSEPAEFELWLKGLRPETSNQERFERIKDGLIARAWARADFYMSFEPLAPTWNAIETLGYRPRPTGGWMITNPVSARLGLSDFFLLARLLRAEVSANGQVTYPKPSWMDVLHFEALLHQKDDETTSQQKQFQASSPRDYEEVLRSVFDYVCDLIQNAVELSDERERRAFQPADYPEPQRQVKHWRSVFDEESEEIERQKDRREYKKNVRGPPGGGGTGARNGSGTSGPSKPKDDQAGWSERFLKSRDNRHRIGLAFSGAASAAQHSIWGPPGITGPGPFTPRGLSLHRFRRRVYRLMVARQRAPDAALAGPVGLLGRLDRSFALYSNYLAPLTGILSADTWTMGLSWVRKCISRAA